MTNTIDIREELKQNFIDSSYDVNANRAFPDARDGLKPGQRCCLWEMYHKKYFSSKAHVKSAKVAGGVIANFWPHSDQAIYETFVRMSQPFINNGPEVDFHGANGNVVLGGDAFASSRYTEARLSKLAEQGLFYGIDKNNVDMVLNFSEDEYMPKVLPAVFPRLLVNGSQGMGVGVAQHWVTHNLKETGDLLIDYIKTGNIDYDNYYPDFPTGGVIINKDELATINRTGKGRILVEGKYRVKKNEIEFFEFPYQVYIEPVIEEIKKAIEKEKIRGISHVLNKSDKKSICLSIGVAYGFTSEDVVRQLFDNTSLRQQINVNQNAIISKTPVMLNLEDMCAVYEQHNTECIKREYQFEYDKTKKRVEILEGLILALANIDDVVNIIKASESNQDARVKLSDRFGFSDLQLDAILNMKLSRLTHLEHEKLQNELLEKQKYLKVCEKIINSPKEQKKILIKRLSELVKEFNTARRTLVEQKDVVKDSAEQKKTVEDIVISWNLDGYIKNIPAANFKGRKTAQNFSIKSNEVIYLFSSLGKVYRCKGDTIKTCAMTDKGQAYGAVFKLEPSEKIVSVMSEQQLKDSNMRCVMVSKDNKIKCLKLSAVIGSTQNFQGMLCYPEPENVILVKITNKNNYIRVVSNSNQSLQLPIDVVGEKGKTALGVKVMNLHKDETLVEAKIEIEKNKYFGNRGTRGKVVS